MELGRERSREAALAWTGLVAYVMTYDIWALTKEKETMSGAWARWITSWPGLLTCGAGWTVITAHLWYNALRGEKGAAAKAAFASVDPIGLAARAVVGLVARQEGNAIANAGNRRRAVVSPPQRGTFGLRQVVRN